MYITEEQYEDLIRTMGIYKKKIMEYYCFYSEDDLKFIKEKDFEYIRDEIIDWKLYNYKG